MENNIKMVFSFLARSKPYAFANIKGGEKYPQIEGKVEFYALGEGTIVATQISSLPKTETQIFAEHIHEGESCKDDFKQTLGHYNPSDEPHPCHAGDMPPLFSNDGNAFSVFYTTRFVGKQILGKTVVVHENPDDFSSQPAGNSGEKIACGVIEEVPVTASFWRR